MRCSRRYESGLYARKSAISSARVRLGPSATFVRDTVRRRIRLAWFAFLRWETIERMANAGCWVTSTNLRARNVRFVLGRISTTQRARTLVSPTRERGRRVVHLAKGNRSNDARCTGPVMPRRDRAPSRKRRRSRSGARWIGESQEINHSPKQSLRKQSSRKGRAIGARSELSKGCVHDRVLVAEVDRRRRLPKEAIPDRKVMSGERGHSPNDHKKVAERNDDRSAGPSGEA